MRQVPGQALVLRTRAQLSDGDLLIETVRGAFPEATLLYNPARGSVRIMTAPGANDDARVLAFVKSLEAAERPTVSVVVEQGAAYAGESNRLDLLVKRAFDPHDILPRRRGHLHAAEAL